MRLHGSLDVEGSFLILFGLDYQEQCREHDLDKEIEPTWRTSFVKKKKKKTATTATITT